MPRSTGTKMDSRETSRPGQAHSRETSDAGPSPLCDVVLPTRVKVEFTNGDFARAYPRLSLRRRPVSI
jgi:hypothetical protein